MAPTAPDFSQPFPPLLPFPSALTLPAALDVPRPPDGLPESVYPVYQPVNPVLSGLPSTDTPHISLPGLPEPGEIAPAVNPSQTRPTGETTEDAAEESLHSGPTVMIPTKVPQTLADDIDAAWRNGGFASRHAYTIWVLTNHHRLLTAAAQITNLTNKLSRAAADLDSTTAERDRLRQRLMDANAEINAFARQNPPLPAVSDPNPSFPVLPPPARPSADDSTLAELARLRTENQTLRAENERLIRLHDQAVARQTGHETTASQLDDLTAIIETCISPALEWLYGYAAHTSSPTGIGYNAEHYRENFKRQIDHRIAQSQSNDQ